MTRMIFHGRKTSGVTLVELLVVTGVTVVLAGLAVGAAQSALEKGGVASEIAAGKNLMAAFHSYAADHDGRYLPGMDGGAKQVTLPDGTRVSNKRAVMRYPLRLAPYFGYEFDGTILVNENRKSVRKSGPDFHYAMTAYPAFGMNYKCVGGEVSGAGIVSNRDECITRQAQSVGSVLVFASAGSGRAYGNVHGYCNVDPPSAGWAGSDPDDSSDAANYGHVDFRHNGRAVCAFLDGSVKLQSIGDLRDMRRWNKNAAYEDDPNYVF